MNSEQLLSFCGDHSKTCKPFTFGNFTYATNGHVLIRVPVLFDVPGWEAVNEKASVMFDALDYPALNTAMVEIPDFPQPEPEKCTACKGVGKISTCPECEGDGEVTLENDYHDYECECQTCNGEGRISGNDSICLHCNGTGNKKVDAMIAMGCAHFSSHYLTMLKELPGMKIAATLPTQANYFKWDGGDGLLMPMRA